MTSEGKVDLKCVHGLSTVVVKHVRDGWYTNEFPIPHQGSLEGTLWTLDFERRDESVRNPQPGLKTSFNVFP